MINLVMRLGLIAGRFRQFRLVLSVIHIWLFSEFVVTTIGKHGGFCDTIQVRLRTCRFVRRAATFSASAGVQQLFDVFDNESSATGSD